MNQINYRSAIYITVFLFSFFHLKSQQEVLKGLDYIYEVVTNPKTENLKSLKKDYPDGTPVTLPFIDDFSGTQIYPDETKWISNNVYINNAFGINPPTLGIATFDAFDATGKWNEDILYDISYQGDVLTSVPIIINESDKDLYLSFLYQPGGNAGAPHIDDSLVLQFYSSDSARWETIWKALNNSKDSLVYEIQGVDTLIWKPAGEKVKLNENDTIYTIPKRGTETNFKLVILSANASADSSFRFRFINYFSVKEETYKGYTGNYTMWHLDYVKLAANRNSNDTVIHDIAFVGRIDSMLRNYTSIPARHFVTDKGNNEWNDKPKITIRNNNDSIVNYNRSIYLKDEKKQIEKKQISEGDTIKSFSILSLNDKFQTELVKLQNALVNDTVDSGIFRYTYFITLNEKNKNINEIVCNDTISQILELTNYYAYDDGTPEFGFGIAGQNTQNARFAVNFDSYLEDTLKGVYIYFNRPAENDNFYFYLTVWNQKGGLPGDTLYSREAVTNFQEGLYQYTYYKLEEPLVINGPFSIGWIQMKEEYLNIGFDRNNECPDKFLNTGSGWVRSKINGSLMIRPVFGEVPDPVGISTIPVETGLKIYPNPVRDILYIDYPSERIQYSIFDMQGRLCKEGLTENNNIDCSDLRKGLYIFSLRINGTVTHKKIIVAGTY